MSSPVHLILNVPGPSGLNDARQNSPLVSWVVGSPAPNRYADKQAAGPAPACVTAPPLIRSTVASGCREVLRLRVGRGSGTTGAHTEPTGGGPAPAVPESRPTR